MLYAAVKSLTHFDLCFFFFFFVKEVIFISQTLWRYTTPPTILKTDVTVATETLTTKVGTTEANDAKHKYNIRK